MSKDTNNPSDDKEPPPDNDEDNSPKSQGSSQSEETVRSPLEKPKIKPQPAKQQEIPPPMESSSGQPPASEPTQQHRENPAKEPTPDINPQPSTTSPAAQDAQDDVLLAAKLEQAYPDQPICPVCHQVISDPAVIDPCFHSVCLECCDGLISNYNRCPTCSSPVNNVMYNIRGNFDYDQFHLPDLDMIENLNNQVVQDQDILINPMDDDNDNAKQQQNADPEQVAPENQPNFDDDPGLTAGLNNYIDPDSEIDTPNQQIPENPELRYPELEQDMIGAPSLEDEFMTVNPGTPEEYLLPLSVTVNIYDRIITVLTREEGLTLINPNNDETEGQPLFTSSYFEPNRIFRLGPNIYNEQTIAFSPNLAESFMRELEGRRME